MTDPLDLDRLVELAEAAWVPPPGGWYPALFFTSLIDGDDAQLMEDADAAYLAAVSPSTVLALVRELREAREVIEDMVRQFAYWSDSVGGVGTGGLSTLEYAFAFLGWDDPHPLPDRRCDEPGCMADATMGWPTRSGGTGPNGGYRRTCWDHSATGKARAALRDKP